MLKRATRRDAAGREAERSKNGIFLFLFFLCFQLEDRELKKWLEKTSVVHRDRQIWDEDEDRARLKQLSLTRTLPGSPQSATNGKFCKHCVRICDHNVFDHNNASRDWRLAIFHRFNWYRWWHGYQIWFLIKVLLEGSDCNGKSTGCLEIFYLQNVQPIFKWKITECLKIFTFNLPNTFFIYSVSYSTVCLKNFSNTGCLTTVLPTLSKLMSARFRDLIRSTFFSDRCG